MSRWSLGLAAVLAVPVWAGAARAQQADLSPAVPVTTQQVAVQDVPVYLSGLGTVEALNTVEIKAQVTGTLTALPVAEGKEVRTGDIVAEIDPRPFQAALDQALAQRQADLATLHGAQLDLQRYQNLAKSSFAPRQQVDDQEATVEKTQAAIAVDSAQIEAARINLGYCVIRSPINGRVGLYQLDVGNLVQAGGTTGILSITQDKPIAMVFTLPEADLAQVLAAHTRGKVTVQVATGERPDVVKAEGVLLTPDNKIDTSTGTIALKAQFDNATDALWPGEFVNARIRVDTLKDAITVPLKAVQHGPDGTFVYRVQPDQTVAQVPVKVGYQDATIATIAQGLSAKDTVVVSGQSRLAPGLKIKPAAAQS
ncbi:MAG TPA: efflux RND transporter periplasmic adaptor subunit [Rhodopila sp.]|uniref:efflux RND transporter periplasmic adaptor subunit n=1 Tax=Rhodopila sp. TaxID=2480087 RepID=UPI002BBAD665|nr:efflux RND transporter periplasmic adaptor subunit [Rhodopila sp.]HVY18203.1 efflux RND transporter periplasmic adaptor subunit [Rhodopila sp.]